LTDGFRVFTAEGARRIDVAEHPRPLPPALLQTASGETIDLASLQGRWLLVDFIYTRCLSYCSVQGNEFARLEKLFAGPIAEGKVLLLSISFDPAHDGPEQLADYQCRSRRHGPGWIAARPTSTELDALMGAFGVIAIPDGLDGYVHNAAINVVDPGGRLVAILDWDEAAAAERCAATTCWTTSSRPAGCSSRPARQSAWCLPGSCFGGGSRSIERRSWNPAACLAGSVHAVKPTLPVSHAPADRLIHERRRPGLVRA